MTILGIKGTSTEGNDPATAFELFALLFDSQVVSHGREIHVIMVALKLTEVAVYMIISDLLQICFWDSRVHKQDRHAIRNGHKQPIRIVSH